MYVGTGWDNGTFSDGKNSLLIKILAPKFNILKKF